MVTGIGQLEVDPIDGDAVNYDADAPQVVVSRSGDRILVDIKSGDNGVVLTFHNREAMREFIRLLEMHTNV